MIYDCISLNICGGRHTYYLYTTSCARNYSDCITSRINIWRGNYVDKFRYMVFTVDDIYLVLENILQIFSVYCLSTEHQKRFLFWFISDDAAQIH